MPLLNDSTEYRYQSSLRPLPNTYSKLIKAGLISTAVVLSACGGSIEPGSSAQHSSSSVFNSSVTANSSSINHSAHSSIPNSHIITTKLDPSIDSDADGLADIFDNAPHNAQRQGAPLWLGSEPEVNGTTLLFHDPLPAIAGANTLKLPNTAYTAVDIAQLNILLTQHNSPDHVRSIQQTRSGDIDGDGINDMVSLSLHNNGALLAWHNTTTPAALPHNTPHIKHQFIDSALFESNSLIISLQLADMDNDNDLDIFVAFGHGQAFWYINDGMAEPNFTPQLALEESSLSKAWVFDSNNDGLSDLLINKQHTFTLYRQNPAASPNTQPTYTASTLPRTQEDSDLRVFYGVAFGDIDNNGTTDIVAAAQGQVSAFLNTSAGFKPVWLHQHTQDLYGYLLDTAPVLGDLNNDGLLDVAVNFSEFSDDSSSLHIRSFVVGLINHGNLNSNKLSLNDLTLEDRNNPQPAPFSHHLLHYFEQGVGGLQSVDIDQDGDQDLVTTQVRFNNNAAFLWLENTGIKANANEPHFTLQYTGAHSNDAHSSNTVTANDINGNGNNALTGSIHDNKAVINQPLSSHIEYLAEGQTLSLNLQQPSTQNAAPLGATDADGDALLYSIAGGPDGQHALLTLSAQGLLTFGPAPLRNQADDANNDNVYSFWLAASDGVSQSNRLVHISVYTDDGDADNDGINDNEDELPHDPRFNKDVDRDGLPDNLDNDSDNDGVVDVQDNAPFDASSNVGPKWAPLPLIIGNLKALSVSHYFVAEGQHLSIAELATDDDNNTLHYSLGGIDGGLTALFHLDEQSGVITLVGAPSLAQALDSNGDNRYHLTLTVSDTHSEQHRDIEVYVYANSDDRDGDSFADSLDAFPLNPAEHLDSDGDNIGNFQDTDDDNDKVVDYKDNAPRNPLYHQAPSWLNTPQAAPQHLIFNLDGYDFGPASNAHSTDLDGDGDNDVIIISYQNNTVAWLENNGNANPQFSFHFIDQGGYFNSTVEVADINGDGYPDIHIHTSSGSILWYINDGGSNPTFHPHVIADDGGRGAQHIDYDRDGDLDVVRTLPDSQEIIIYLNDGAITPQYSALVIKGVSTRGTVVDAQDYDSDNDIDLLIYIQDKDNHRNSELMWLENIPYPQDAAQNTFLPRVISRGTSANIISEDLDNDGDIDIVLNKDDDFYWLENTPLQGRFKQQQLSNDYAESAFSITDITGNGKLDILQISGVLLSNAGTNSNFFQGDPRGSIFYYNNFAQGDINGNGLIDRINIKGNQILLSQDIDRLFIVPESTVDIGQEAATEIEDQPLNYSITLGPDAHLFAVDQQGNIRFKDSAPNVNTAQDNNADNRYDFWLTVTDGNSTLERRLQVWVLQNDDDFDDDGVINEEDDFPYDPLENSDFDNDGLGNNTDPDNDNDGVLNTKDIAPFDKNNSHPPQWTHNPNAGSNATLNTVTDIRNMQVADMNNDDYNDILGISSSGTIILALNDGSQAVNTYTQHALNVPPLDIRLYQIHDLDNDGDQDIVITQNQAGAMVWLESDGATQPQFSLHTVTNDFQFITDFTVADINNDGHKDIASFSRGEGDSDEYDAYDLKEGIRWFENSGNAQALFTSHTIDAIDILGGQIVIADLDNDGDADIATSRRQAVPLEDGIYWYENDNNSGDFHQHHVITQEPIALNKLIDINQDGKLDIVSKDHWFENMEAPFNRFMARPLPQQYIFYTPIKNTVSEAYDLGYFSTNSNLYSYPLFTNTNQLYTAPRVQLVLQPDHFALDNSTLFADINNDGLTDALWAENNFSNPRITWRTTLYTAYNLAQGSFFVGQHSASDPDSNTLSYRISHGPDSEFFTIDNLGNIHFKANISNASALDKNGDNRYSFWVGASDGAVEIYNRIEVTVQP